MGFLKHDYWITNSPDNRRIIAKLFNKWGEARFPPYPPMLIRSNCQSWQLLGIIVV